MTDMPIGETTSQWWRLTVTLAFAPSRTGPTDPVRVPFVIERPWHEEVREMYDRIRDGEDPVRILSNHAKATGWKWALTHYPYRVTEMEIEREVTTVLKLNHWTPEEEGR